jgi:hypothetical protein
MIISAMKSSTIPDNHNRLNTYQLGSFRLLRRQNTHGVEVCHPLRFDLSYDFVWCHKIQKMYQALKVQMLLRGIHLHEGVSRFNMFECLFSYTSCQSPIMSVFFLSSNNSSIKNFHITGVYKVQNKNKKERKSKGNGKGEEEGEEESGREKREEKKGKRKKGREKGKRKKGREKREEKKEKRKKRREKREEKKEKRKKGREIAAIVIMVIGTPCPISVYRLI